MADLEHAISLAVQAHYGQRDKSGKPYILHPLRMMIRLQTEPEMIAAVLHDVVEDTPYTLDDLKRAGFSEEVLLAVDCLTRREDESYEDFIERAKNSPIAVRVKIADIEDNMDVRRLYSELSQTDLERLQKYKRAWDKLMAFLAQSQSVG